MSAVSSSIEMGQKYDSTTGKMMTQFSRTNKSPNKMVNIKGVGMGNKYYVKKTVLDKSGYGYMKNYIMPESRVMELLTGSVSLMNNDNKVVKHHKKNKKSNKIKKSHKKNKKIKKSKKVKKSHKKTKKVKKIHKKSKKSKKVKKSKKNKK